MQPNLTNHATLDPRTGPVASAPIPLTRRVIALLAVTCAVSVATIYSAQPVLEPIGEDLSIAKGDVGWVVTTAQIGYLAGLLLVVPLGDIVDRRRLIVRQLGGVAACLLLVAAAPTSWLFFVAIAAVGLCAVVVQVVVAYAAAMSDPAERGRVVGVITSGVVVGILLARTVAGAVADVSSWRVMYVASAVVSAALATALARLLPADTAVRERMPYRQVVASVAVLWSRVRVFRVRATITLFLFASFGALWSSMALQLGDDPWNMSTTQIGLFGFAGLAGAMGAARAGRWADRGWGERTTVAALVILTASWGFSSFGDSSLVLFTIGVILLDFAIQAVHVTSQNLIVADAPAASSRIIGGNMVFYSIGSGLGAVTATATFGAAGWNAVCLLGAGYAATALAVWMVDRAIPRG